MENKTNVNAKHNDNVELPCIFKSEKQMQEQERFYEMKLSFEGKRKKDLIDNIVIHVAGPQRGGLFLQPVCTLFTHSTVIISEELGQPA